MTSLPNPSHVGLETQGPHRHRHRRSAAILGDFDVVGLGLYSPQKPKLVELHSTPNHYDPPYSFAFNNETDFVQPATKFSFSFPVDLPAALIDLPRNTTSSPMSHSASAAPNYAFHHLERPRQGSVTSVCLFGNLNSPIRLASSRRSHLMHAGSVPRWESSSLGPEEQIDLDTVLRAMLIEKNTTKNPASSAPDTVFADLSAYMGSPFAFSSGPSADMSPFVRHGLPVLSLPQQLLFQPIQESNLALELADLKELGGGQAGDIVEEPDVDGQEPILDQELMFANPPSLSGLYSNDLANLSCLSLRSGRTGQPIEKQFLNDLITLGFSGFNAATNGSGTPNKRSAAKASRYQLFYDQHYKILNALKILSSESINLFDDNTREHILGHSLLLPLLKTNQKRTLNTYAAKLLRFQHSVRDFSGNNNIRRMLPPLRGRSQVQVLNSPNSVALEVLATTIQLTEHLSIHENLTGHLSILEGQDGPKLHSTTVDPTPRPLDNSYGPSQSSKYPTLGTYSELQSEPLSRTSSSTTLHMDKSTPLIVVTDDPENVRTPVLSVSAVMRPVSPDLGGISNPYAVSTPKNPSTLVISNDQIDVDVISTPTDLPGGFSTPRDRIDNFSTPKHHIDSLNMDGIESQMEDIDNPIIPNRRATEKAPASQYLHDREKRSNSPKVIPPQAQHRGRPRPRRPVLPEEEQFLRYTRIPSFKQTPKNPGVPSDDTGSIKTSKRNSKLISWFKKSK